MSASLQSPGVQTPFEGAPSPPSPVKAAPKRNFFTRSRARRMSLIRDMLASIKDTGLILAVLAILLFHDQVADHLASLGLLREGANQVIDLHQGLTKLSMAVDTQPLVDASGNMTRTVKARTQTARAQKAIRSEQKILNSEDAVFVTDWTVVIATTADLNVAQSIGQAFSKPDQAVYIAQKGDRFKVFLRTDTPEATQSVLNRARINYPYAVSASLKSWCSPKEEAPALEVCSKT